MRIYIDEVGSPYSRNMFSFDCGSPGIILHGGITSSPTFSHRKIELNHVVPDSAFKRTS